MNGYVINVLTNVNQTQSILDTLSVIKSNISNTIKYL
jgi:hypothetical protein